MFLTLYEPFLKEFVASLHGNKLTSGSAGVSPPWDFTTLLSGWDRAFDKVLKSIEDKVAQDRKSRLRGAITSKEVVANPSPPSADEASTSGLLFFLNLRWTMVLTLDS